MQFSDKKMGKFIHLISFLLVLIKYLSAPKNISQEYVISILIIVFLNIVIFYLNKERKRFYGNRFLNITNIFIILYVIVSFQIPLDYALGNEFIKFDYYFYDTSIVNLSISFSTLCLIAYLLGSQNFNVSKHFSLLKHLNSSDVKIPIKPIYKIMFILWILFIIFMSPNYVNGGHGTVSVNSISIASFGYFWRINLVYLTICLLNNKQRELGLMEIIKSQPISYWCLIILSVMIFFMAHNRVNTLYLLVPLFFYFQILSKIKLGFGKSFLIIIVVAVFFTLFKLYGISAMFSSTSNLNVTDLSNFDRFASISPFTSELAASVYSDTVLFYLWYNNGIMILGSTFVLGLLRIVSGLVPLFFLITGLSVETYDSASVATTYVGAPYGIGSTITGDLLLSVGFVLSIITMYFFGYFCSKCDISLISIKTNNSPTLFISLFAFSSQIAFVSRGSLCDIIATTLFCILFFKIYTRVVKSRSI